MTYIRTTKFFGICYADDVQEAEFFAKNFAASLYENFIVLSFDFMRGLDFDKIKPYLTDYTFYEIEDLYLRDRLITFLEENTTIKKLQFKIGELTVSVKQLKFTNKGVVISLI